MAPAINTYDREKRRTVAASRHDTLCVRALFGFLLAIKDFTALWRQQSWRKNDVNSDNQQKVLAYVFGQRKDEVFLRLQELLKPFGITKFYTDGWGAYERHLDAEQHRVGKENTQKIEVLWYLPEYKIVIISITYANMSLSQNIERASNS